MTRWLLSDLFRRRARVIEALYYHWLTHLLKALQRIDVIRDTVQVKNEIARIYTWYQGLDVFIKPEEDAIAAVKMKEEYERLEKTKNIKFDENFTGLSSPNANTMKPILIKGNKSMMQGRRDSSVGNKDLKAMIANLEGNRPLTTSTIGQGLKTIIGGNTTQKLNLLIAPELRRKTILLSVPRKPSLTNSPKKSPSPSLKAT